MLRTNLRSRFLLCYTCAAFDTMNHTILLKRLETSYSLQSSVLALIPFFLCGRKQFVILDDLLSNPVICSVVYCKVLFLDRCYSFCIQLMSLPLQNPTVFMCTAMLMISSSMYTAWLMSLRMLQGT